jgi:ribosomal protein L37AE/L43A
MTRDEFIEKHPSIWMKLSKDEKKQLMDLINKKNCPNCGREFTETDVPSGTFCCIACEHGY